MTQRRALYAACRDACGASRRALCVARLKETLTERGAAGDATVDLDPTATEPRVVAEAGGSPSPGACGPTPGVLTNATGVVTDGSGRDGWYLPNVDCRWIVRPDVLAGTRGSRGSGGSALGTPSP